MEEKEIRNILENLGFTSGESRVYLTLLKIGESKVGPIIKDSEISRSKVYDILERLISKGVVSNVKKNDILFYQALSPKFIFSYINEKQEELQQESKILEQIMPQLISLLPKRNLDVKIYTGAKGFKKVIDRTIEELRKDDVYEAMGISKTTEFMRNYALKIYQAQKTKNFKARSIFDELGQFKIIERKNKLHKTRVLPKGWHTPALFTIYKDTTGIHLGNEETIISIVIRNKDIASSFRATFEAMWKISKEIIK